MNYQSLGAALVVTAGVLFAIPAQADSFRLEFGTPQGNFVFQDGRVHSYNQGHHRQSKRRYHRERPRYENVLSDRQIRRSMRHRGFHGIEILKRKRGRTTVMAVGPRGHLGRFKVDSYTGQIIRGRIVERHYERPSYKRYSRHDRFYGRDWR